MSSTTEVISSANALLSAHGTLLTRVRQSQQSHRRQLHTLSIPPYDLLRLPLIPSPPRTPPLVGDSPPPSPDALTASSQRPKYHRPDLSPAKRARLARYSTYVPEEETIRNDYSQRYVDGGEWPQNWVLGAEPERRFEEYPKQQRLLNLKKESINSHSLPSTYLTYSNLSSLHPMKFDVILLDPPFSSSFTWQTLQEVPVPALAADPSFVFLWVGSGAGDGLERGRELLAKWGYRRCEDVVWVKTNKTGNLGPGTDPPTTSLLTRTKQHCLIGIRGTVRRSTDSWFVHCNVDTDVIIWEGDPADPTRKPPEMYTLIENFCLGTRRLELFGKSRSSLRRGWVTVLATGQEVTADMESTQWDKDSWDASIRELSNGGKFVVPMTADIDALRPKSPFRPGPVPGVGRGNAGGVVGGFGVANNVVAPSPQMQTNAMGMAMNNLGMGGMGVTGMEGIWPMGMGMGVGGMGMNMMGIGMGMPIAQQGMGGAPFGHFNPAVVGLGSPWMDAQGQVPAGWDGSGMEGMMGGNMMGMDMNHGIGMMGQWGPGGAGAGGYEGY